MRVEDPTGGAGAPVRSIASFITTRKNHGPGENGEGSRDGDIPKRLQIGQRNTPLLPKWPRILQEIKLPHADIHLQALRQRGCQVDSCSGNGIFLSRSHEIDSILELKNPDVRSSVLKRRGKVPVLNTVIFGSMVYRRGRPHADKSCWRQKCE